MIAGIIIALLIASGILAAVFFHLKSNKKTHESLLKNQQRGFEEVNTSCYVALYCPLLCNSIVSRDIA